MDKLFLLKPDFTDDKIDNKGQAYYCPSCATIEGVLSYYPLLREKLEVIYVDFPKPRHQISALIGEANQGCPVLILEGTKAMQSGLEGRKTHGDESFLNTTQHILQYLAQTYQIGLPHP